MIMTGLGFLAISSPSLAQDLEIVNIRVGQGDATLIQGPADAMGNRVNVLFDAGDIPDRDAGNIIRTVLWKRGVTALDYHLVISHDDADHLGGVAAGGVHGDSPELARIGTPDVLNLPRLRSVAIPQIYL